MLICEDCGRTLHEDDLVTQKSYVSDYAGGVMSDGIIREALQSRFDCCFAEPAFSADNACGTAVYAAVKDGFIK